MQTNSARTVLIVEPDEDSRSALRSALEGDGYTVISTASAAAALSVVDGQVTGTVAKEGESYILTTQSGRRYTLAASDLMAAIQPGMQPGWLEGFIGYACSRRTARREC
jgi:CheY-like chemotaxis protein